MVEIIENIKTDGETNFCFLDEEDNLRFKKGIEIYPESKNKEYTPIAFFETIKDSKKYYEYIALTKAIDIENSIELVSVTILEQNFLGVKFPVVLDSKVIEKLKYNTIEINDINLNNTNKFKQDYPLLSLNNFQPNAIITIDGKEDFYLNSIDYNTQTNSSYFSILPLTNKLSNTLVSNKKLVFNHSLALIGQIPSNFKIINAEIDENLIIFHSHNRFGEEINVYETIINKKSNQMIDFNVISHQVIK